MKKINVNEETCIGCGACVAIDSEHFAFNDEGLSHATNNENLESENLLNAIDSCPTSAISIKECEDDTCECGCDDECGCTAEDNCGCHCYDDEECKCDDKCEHCHHEED